MALHKIAYFAHGWRLAETGEPMIQQQFEAWNYGPVLRSVYDAFKSAGRAKITTRARGFDPVARMPFIVQAKFLPEDRAFLRAILAAYGRYSAERLSGLTHLPGGAWDRVWNAQEGRITLGMRIPDEAIRGDFLAGRMDPSNARGHTYAGASRHWQ
jgi:uncharacterized phage-associated protein